jgi:hypothetical protein
VFTRDERRDGTIATTLAMSSVRRGPLNGSQRHELPLTTRPSKPGSSTLRGLVLFWQGDNGTVERVELDAAAAPPGR